MIGSLNSMTFLKPFSIWKKPFAWLNRCQVAGIEAQYELYNVRAFDLHIYFVGEKERAIFKHGNVEYYTFSIFEILNYLDKKGDVYVRLVLEEDCDDKSQSIERRFKSYCKNVETIYKNTKFFGGYRECDSFVLYNFKEQRPEGLYFFRRVDKLKRKRVGEANK